MAVFEYQALNQKGKRITGIIDAESIFTAKSKLRNQKIFPSLVKPLESGAYPGKSHPFKDIFSYEFSGRVSTGELALMTRQLSTLLSAGFPLVKAVTTLIPQSRSKTMKKALSKIKDRVEQGSSFASALSTCPNVFTPIYINMVDAGESSGTLELVLERLADFTENKEAARKKIQAALAYPVLMALVASLVLIVLLTYVVPGIVTIFSDLNQTLPLPTIVLIHLSQFMSEFWWGIVSFPFTIYFAIQLLRKTGKGLVMTDRLLLNIPFLGGFIKKNITARFTRTLGSLLENGVPLLSSLKISRNVVGNEVITALISNACETVEQGGELSEVLMREKLFPNLASQMIQVGEASGEIEKMLNKTADLYEKQVQSDVVTVTSIIEPVIILIMGVVVGSIIMAIFMPIFEINQFIR